MRLLVHPFLAENQTQFRKHLNRLLPDPTDRPDLIFHLEQGPLAYALRKQLKSIKDENYQKSDFDRRIGIIRENWELLDKKRPEFESLRNEVFAHLELESRQTDFKRSVLGQTFEGTFDTFGSSQTPSLSDLCQSIEEVIPRIALCLRELAFVLVRANFHSQQLRNSAKRAASLFWKAQRSN